MLDLSATSTHAASQWQIRADASPSDYSVVAFDSGPSVASLTSIDIPSAALGYYTRYSWRVRHQSSTGLWGGWSA